MIPERFVVEIKGLQFARSHVHFRFYFRNQIIARLILEIPPKSPAWNGRHSRFDNFWLEIDAGKIGRITEAGERSTNQRDGLLFVYARFANKILDQNRML